MKLRTLSIIQYQNISDSPHLHRLWLSLNSFRRQMEHLSGNGFRIISMDDAVDYMLKRTGVKYGRPVSLTFDNGYLDFYGQAYPLLSELGFSATVIVNPKRVGKEIKIGDQVVPYMTWGHLKELVKGPITIGAYEDAAWNINEISEDVVKGHIHDFKKRLEDKLGIEVRYFGCKEGIPGPEIRDALISAGYRAFLTQCPTYRKSELFSIGRIQVDDDDFNIFLTKISRTYLFFKDKKSWEYIRKYNLDRVAHRLSETYDRIRGNR
ncbi:MAG: polysaccharide deacetylase family protein [Deltaproteobacteria bacterium]|nr:polysaccharide deacetylase family protein [Deltaproteobacteria bacterium]